MAELDDLIKKLDQLMALLLEMIVCNTCEPNVEHRLYDKANYEDFVARYGQDKIDQWKLEIAAEEAKEK